MGTQIKGKCRCCSKEFTKTGIIKHLNSCKERIDAEAKIKTGKTTEYFELLITAKYQKEYWLVIEIEETAKLKDLDQFIRDIWVECCGHLSSFYIDGVLYDSQPSNGDFWGPPSKSMVIQLKKVLSVGMQISYEYDFGSTTELLITVKGHRTGKKKKEPITILSRNNPPEIICSICNNNTADWVNPEGFYDETPFWCNECIEKRECEEEDEEDDYFEEDFFLPICNSPRMGVCGYEGSIKYPD